MTRSHWSVTSDSDLHDVLLWLCYLYKHMRLDTLHKHSLLCRRGSILQTRIFKSFLNWFSPLPIRFIDAPLCNVSIVIVICANKFNWGGTFNKIVNQSSKLQTACWQESHWIIMCPTVFRMCVATPISDICQFWSRHPLIYHSSSVRMRTSSYIVYTVILLTLPVYIVSSCSSSLIHFYQSVSVNMFITIFNILP